MTTVRSQPVYQDHLTYPVVFNHRFYEMSGRMLNNRITSGTKTLTVEEYEDLIYRINQLETMVNRLIGVNNEATMSARAPVGDHTCHILQSIR